ncbi:MAG: sulfurtransferase TusA family protein [Nitrospiraceae bacterium]|nr:sulfurtransferase TusA family protein [Nitrospiraceae bacterium]
MAELAADVKVDCKGLTCPMPVVKTKKALSQITSGQVLEVTATDPGSKSDIPALVRNMGSELLETRDEQGSVVFLIRKK